MLVYQQQSGGINGDFIVQKSVEGNGYRIPKRTSWAADLGKILESVPASEYSYHTRDLLGSCVNSGEVWDVTGERFGEWMETLPEWVQDAINKLTE